VDVDYSSEHQTVDHTVYIEINSLQHDMTMLVVYYESIKRELQRRPIYECRCDERLKTKAEGSTMFVNEAVEGSALKKKENERKRKKFVLPGKESLDKSNDLPGKENRHITSDTSLDA